MTARKPAPPPKPPVRPIVALLTDFGTQDHYVGAVKGAILEACPEAALVDIAHDLPVHDVPGGAFSLASVFRAFPGGTVFLAVVDPGVGSRRRGLAARAAGYFFVGPDNGVLTHVLREDEGARVHEIKNAALFRREVAATFHARDIFGPVAGHLARGAPLKEVGPAVADPVLLSVEAARRKGEREWEGVVIHVDRFGNLTTNVTRRDMDEILSHVGGDPTEVVVLVEGAVLPLARSYFEVAEGEPCALMGSSGRLEVAVNRENASRLLGATRGAPVVIRLVRAGS